MFGRRPTGRLLYAWDFAEVRWQKIREIREKLSAATSDASKCPQSFCHNPSRKGTFKAQKAINMLKEYGWICTTLSSGRSTSATHPALAQANKQKVCRIHRATGGATASIPKRGLGKTTY